MIDCTKTSLELIIMKLKACHDHHKPLVYRTGGGGGGGLIGDSPGAADENIETEIYHHLQLIKHTQTIHLSGNTSERD